MKFKDKYVTLELYILIFFLKFKIAGFEMKNFRKRINLFNNNFKLFFYIIRILNVIFKKSIYSKHYYSINKNQYF